MREAHDQAWGVLGEGVSNMHTVMSFFRGQKFLQLYYEQLKQLFYCNFIWCQVCSIAFGASQSFFLFLQRLCILLKLSVLDRTFVFRQPHSVFQFLNSTSFHFQKIQYPKCTATIICEIKHNIFLNRKVHYNLFQKMPHFLMYNIPPFLFQKVSCYLRFPALEIWVFSPYNLAILRQEIQ